MARSMESMKRASIVLESLTEAALHPQIDDIQTSVNALAGKSDVVTALMTRWDDETTPVPPPVYPTHNPFGLHYVVAGSHDGYGTQLLRLADAGHPMGLVKAMFDKGALGQAKTISPQTCTIYRQSIDDNDFPPTEQGSWYWQSSAACHQSAVDWMTACNAAWANERESIDYFELINEPNQTDAQLGWFMEWSGYCLDIADAMGYPLAWGGFSTGTPSEQQMIVMLPFLEDMALRGHILAVHDGAVVEPFTFQGTATDPNAEQAASSLRYRWWKRQADNAGRAFPRVAVTECYAYGQKTPEFYTDWRWYIEQCAADAYLLGVAWYTLGDGGDFGNVAGRPLSNVVDQCLAIDWGNL